MPKRIATKAVAPPSPIRDWAGFALIFLLNLLVYAPALNGGLLWDDSAHVTGPQLQSLHGLLRIWFDVGATQQYYPLLHSAFWIEHKLWGDAMLGYHLVNVMLHSLSACLVVLIVRRLRLPGGWIAGFLFALHPVCVESVAWVSEQKSTLSAAFYLGSALVYLSYVDSRKMAHYLLAAGLFFCALLSKTVTATLPAALLVVLWWRQGKLDWKRDIAPLLPWIGIGAAAGLVTAWVEKTIIGASGATYGLPLIDRCLLAGKVIWFYAYKLVLPLNLTFIYPRWTITTSVAVFLVGVLVAAGALTWLTRRNRGPLAAFLFFVGTLFPVLGFFNVYPFRFSWVADHFQYLASLGLIVPAAWALSMMKQARIATGVLLVILGGLTFAQAGTYKDAVTLYRETLARNPDCWLAHDNLGNILLDELGQRDEAVAEFQAALRLKPDYWEAHLSLGNALLQIPGRLDEALTEFQAAVRIEPHSERTHNNYGEALYEAGRNPEAISELRESLRIKPDYAQAHINLGNVLVQTPEGLPQAVDEYKAALRSDPGNPSAMNNLGGALAQLPGRLPEAIAQFEAALRIQPGNADAHTNLGAAFLQMPGRQAEAVAHLRAATQLKPDFPTAHVALADALSKIPGKSAEAIQELQIAVQLDPDNWQAHYMLGNLLSQESGHTAEAIAEYEAVLKVNPNPDLKRLVEMLRSGRK